MNTLNHAGVRLVTSAIVMAFVLGTMIGPLTPRPTPAAQAAESGPVLDLPAMVLTPADLREAGLDGAVYSSAKTLGHYGGDSFAYLIGQWTEQVSDDDIRATLEDAGLGRGYRAGLLLRADLADPRSEVVGDIDGALFEFPDPDGATAALGLIDELTANSNLVERIEGEQAVGDASLLLRIVREGSDQPSPIALAFRVDRLVAILQISAYPGGDPEPAAAETLAAPFQSRIAAGLSGDTPGLGSRVLRLMKDKYPDIYEVRQDQYLRLAGEDFPLNLEEADALAARAKAAGDATDVYALNQFTQDAETDPPLPYQFGWGARLYRFADEGAASDWLAAQPDLITTESASGGEAGRDVEPLADFPSLGDESVAVTYLRDSSGGYTDRVFRVLARVGAVVADVKIVAFEDDSPIEAFQALATDEVGCLQNGCGEPTPISDALAGKVSYGGQGGQPSKTEGPFDLSAMTLVPADLDSAGMNGFGLGFGQTASASEVIASTAAARGMDEREVGRILGDAALVRRYDSYLYHPENANDPSAPANRIVASYVLEFGDAAGAAAAFPLLEDESGSQTAEDVPDAPKFGDQSEVTHDVGEDAASGARSVTLDLSFRLGNLEAGVAIVDWTGTEPDMADLEALGLLLVARIQRVQQDGAPGLGSQAIRLTGEGIVPSADYYLMVDGTANPLSGESAQDLRDREQAASDAGRTDVYRVWQQLYPGTEETADDVWYLLELSRFSDDAAAEDWVAAIEENFRTNDAYADVLIRPKAAPVGDDAVAYRYTNGDAHFRGFILRIGSTTAVLDVYGPETPPADALESLLESLAACIDGGGCVDPVEMPADLAQYIAGLQGGVPPEGTPSTDKFPPVHVGIDETPEPDTDATTYVDPTWGYTVAWDPEQWVRTSNDGDEGIEFHIMGSVITIAKIRGIEAYDGDAEACLAGMVENAGAETPLVPAADLPAPQTADGAAGGLYTLGDFGVLYFECRTLVPGQAVLEIRFGSPAGDYEASLSALKTLLAGITLPTGDARPGRWATIAIGPALNAA